VFGDKYVLYRIKYYIKYSPLNTDEYMHDGGRTDPDPPLLLSDENPKPCKTRAYAFKGTQFLRSWMEITE